MQDVDVGTIRKKLVDMSLVKVAAATGLHYLTVRKVRDGESVTLKTLGKLDEYFKGRGK